MTTSVHENIIDDPTVVFPDSSCYDFNFTSDMPLCSVALLARRMRRNMPIGVISMDVDCCVALHLFVELCREAG